MKNIKKVLCLALAFAMVLGLCVSGFAVQDVTTLPDWDEVANKDAVTLLNAFEIMQGDDRGFRPDDPVTRAEAAKMLSVALWGGDETAAKLYANGNAGNFSDVAGHWAIGNINYMAVNGIINGDGNGKFRPDDTVSGYELLKMCLTTIGYDAEKAGLTGTGWDLRAMSLATKRTSKKDLTSGTTVTNWSSPISRANAAQVIANMIERNVVHYDDKGALVEDYEAGDSFGTEILGMTQYDGRIVGNAWATIEDVLRDIDATDLNDIEVTGAITAKGKNSYIQKVDEEGENVGTPFAWTTETTLADLGKPVSVYLRDEKVISVAVKEPGTVVTLNLLKLADCVADACTLRVNGVAMTAAEACTALELLNDEQQPLGLGAVLAAPYVSYTAYDANADGKADAIFAVCYADMAYWPGGIVKIADVTTDDNGVEWYTVSIDNADVKVKTANCNFEAKKDEYVVYHGDINARGELTAVGYVMETLEGEVTRVFSNGNIRIGTETFANSDVNAGEDNAIVFGTKGTFYLYEGGSVAMCIGAVDNTVLPYAVLIQAGAYSTKAGSLDADTAKYAEVKVVTPDGKTAIYSLSTLNGSDDFITVNNQGVASFKEGCALKNYEDTPMLVQYVVSADGKSIDLVTTGDKYTAVVGTGLGNITANTQKVTLGNGSVYQTKDTVTFVETKTGTTSKWTVVNGVNASAFTVSNASKTMIVKGKYMNQNDTGIVYLMLADGSYEVDNTQSASFYYLVSGPDAVKKEGATYTHEVVVFNATTGKLETLSFTSTNAQETYTAKFFTTFSEKLVEADGPQNNVPAGLSGEVEVDIAGFITVVGENGFVVGENNIVDTTKDTKYFLIDGDKTAAITAADLKVQKTAENKIQVAVIYAVNNDQPVEGLADIVIVFKDAVANTTISVPQ